MGKFSASFWNVENFWGASARAADVEAHIRTLDQVRNGPDIVAFCEIKDKGKIREVILEHLGDYDFGLTDIGSERAAERNQAEIELLVGWKRDRFEQSLFTQRVYLKGGRASVRPGAFLNVKFDGIWYSLLFLHTKSGAHKTGYNARKKVFSRIWNMKSALEAIDNTSNHSNGSRLIVMGDLNTMGNGRSISGKDEVDKLVRNAGSNGMSVEPKEFDQTFGQKWRRTNPQISDLDHVITNRVELESLGVRVSDGREYSVAVRGWNQLIGDTAALLDYERRLSDHSAIFVEIKE